ncbi:MAG: AAA family ATPase [Alcaligenaceae bacterium]|nr:AAA family ATPase [Alcaligenaceae bacterium]
MKLRRIRIEQLRQFRRPLEIRDLGPGINLFIGPNESGKSTVVRAIRAAFFERHKSGTVDDLQPWGDSSAAPAIQLDFDWQGEHWALNKSFLKRKRCDLNIDGQVLSGDDAEEKLGELLGYQVPQRGASKAEHWGIPGLLWIDQGTGQDIEDPVSHAGGYLKSALGESLGEVASSAGDELIAQLVNERSALLTATGRATGDYADTQRRYIECEAQLAALDQDIALYRRQVDRLGELQQLRIADATRPWEGLYRQAKQAEERLTEVQGWEQAQQREEQERRQCADNQQLCQDQLASFTRQQDELAQRARDVQKADADLNDLQARRRPIESLLAQAQAAYQTAEQVLRLARRHEQRGTLDRELGRLDQELSEIEARLQQSQVLQAQLLEQRGQLQANRVDAASLKQLQAAGQALHKLDIAQQAVATRLQFELLPEQSILLGNDVLSGQGQRLLLEPVDLNISGIGTLRIQPGGEDIADLGRRRQAAQDRLEAMFGELQVTGLGEAEERAEQRRVLQDDIKRVEFQLESLAPKGLDELGSRQVLAAGRKDTLQAQLAELPKPDETAVDIATAESRLDAARSDLKRAEQAATALERDLGLAAQAQRSTHTEWQRLQGTVQSEDRLQQEKKLGAQLAELRAREAALQESLAGRHKQIEAANPDILRQDIQRFTRSAEALKQEAEQRTLELTGLQGRLDALGANGLEEQHAELAQEFEAIGRRRNEMQQRAAALDLLLELLNAKRRELTLRIQEPLQAHLDHYLRLLFPQARLTVDADLLPDQLVRGSNGGEAYDDFALLSYGAREQMGLISRLAYADLLKDAGRPTLIILDDALVHTDQQRLTPMKRILFDAAQRHQILLFSCHPENWKDLGVVPVEMSALAVGG